MKVNGGKLIVVVIHEEQCGGEVQYDSMLSQAFPV